MVRRRLPANECKQIENVTNKMCVKTTINARLKNNHVIKEINRLRAPPIINYSMYHLLVFTANYRFQGLMASQISWVSLLLMNRV